MAKYSKSLMLDHEKLDVYHLSIDLAVWSYQIGKQLDKIDRHLKDQLMRASHSVPLNIAEGNGKLSPADRRRYFQIASGSARECAAIIDILYKRDVLEKKIYTTGKEYLVRIVSMLTKLILSKKSITQKQD